MLNYKIGEFQIIEPSFCTCFFLSKGPCAFALTNWRCLFCYVIQNLKTTEMVTIPPTDCALAFNLGMSECEFEVSGFKKRAHGTRDDKGRKHKYPTKRKTWN